MTVLNPILRAGGRIARALLLLLFPVVLGAMPEPPVGRSEPKPIREWDIERTTPHVAFTPDGKTMLFTGHIHFALGPGMLTAWNYQTGKQITEDKSHRMSVNRVTISRDGKLIGTAAQAGEVGLFEAGTLKRLALFDGGCECLWQVAFSPDGLLLVASGDKVVKVWDTKTHQNVASLPGLKLNRIAGLAFSPDGKTLAVGDDSAIRLYDVETFKERLALPLGPVDDILSLAFSPDGKTLASATNVFQPGQAVSVVGWVSFWDPETGKQVAATAKHPDSVLHLAFTPDGKNLFMGTGDGKVIGMETDTRKEFVRLNLGGKLSAVRAVAITPDGKFLATSCDRVVKLWSLADLLPPEPKK